MPYRQAHWFVGGVLLVILAGFWFSYFTAITAVPLAFHVHALSASAWLMLVIIQQIAIQRRQIGLHRQLGWASFALFPLLILGFVMIIDVSAQGFARAASPFSVHLGPSFGIGMLIAIAAYLTLFFQALRHRRQVQLHAGYLLATPLILFESPFSRVMGMFLPWMNIIGSSGPQEVLDTIALSDGIAILFALALYAMNRRHGTPWLVAAAFMAVQALAMWYAPFVPALRPVMQAYAQLPLGLMGAIGVTAGALAGWLGWRAGARPRRSAVQAA